MRLALLGQQLSQWSSSPQAGQVGAAKVRVQRRREGNQSQSSSCRDNLGGLRVPLHVEVHVGPPLREVWRGRLHPAAHDDNRLPTQTAGPADLKHREIGVRADGDERRPGVEAALEKIQGSTRRRRSGVMLANAARQRQDRPGRESWMRPPPRRLEGCHHGRRGAADAPRTPRDAPPESATVVMPVISTPVQPSNMTKAHASSVSPPKSVSRW